MAIPIKPNIGTKEDYASRPSVPTNKKENAAEFNLLVSSVRANYERLTLFWSTDIVANSTLEVGQRIHFTDNNEYRITTSYNVGNPITWDASKARKINDHWMGDYDLSVTNDYPTVGSALDGSLKAGDTYKVSVAGTLDLGDGEPTDINIGALLIYTGDGDWKVIQ